MGCGQFCVKYVLFFTNFFFALAGLTLVALGVVVQLQVKVVLDVFEDSLDVAPVLTIVVGSIIFIISFFGCCGAVRESNCMLVTYAVFMILLMVAKIALATIIFVNIESLSDAVPRWLNTAFNQPSLNHFHEIEYAFKCCGTTGPLSYGQISLPESCCNRGPCTVLNSHPGCNEIIAAFFQTFGLVIGIISLAIVSIELVAVVLALCLANHLRNRSRRSRY